MNCPKCESSTEVTDSRKKNKIVVRRRRCKCGERFVTHEVMASIIDRVIPIKGLSMTKSADGHWAVKVDENTPEWAKKMLINL
jgi:transcriptional regulator NrdR family protein